MAVTVEDLDNAQTDATTLAEVVNSREGGVSTGVPINDTVTRAGDTINTVQGQLANLGFQIPAIDWTATTSITSNVQVYRFPITTGDLYVAKVPVPFVTGGTFTPSNWQLVSGFDLFQDPLPRLSNFLDPNGNYIGSDKGADIPSASPLTIGIDGDFFTVTGTVDFASMVVDTNRKFILQFSDVLTITDGAPITISGEADFTTAAGDIVHCFSTAANVVNIINISKADGSPVNNKLGSFLDPNGNYIGSDKGADIPSAPTVVIGTDGDFFAVTGTVDFASMTVAANRKFILEFDDVLTITNGAPITLPGGVNFVTRAGDTLQCFSTAVNTVVVVGMSSINRFTQNVDGNDFELSKVNLKDYGEITNAIGSIGGGLRDIDLELGNSVSATINTSTTEFTFSNPTGSNEKCSFTLLLVNGGSQTIIWPASINWINGVTPSSLSVFGIDVFNFSTFDAGVNWHGDVTIPNSSKSPFGSFDISTISTVQTSASVSSEDTVPTGMAFNNDGTKIYMIGSGSDSFHEYNLGTSFDISTISTVQTSASVSSEDTSPQGMAFNNDGTKIYMIGGNSASFHEYNLGTAFDISTISTVQTSASVSSEDTFPVGMAFNNDGTKIYMIGTGGSDSFHEYNLGTAFDISTISTVQTSASVSSEDPSPQGMAFNNDGTKIYMIGSNSDLFHEYNLGTAFDISTISTVQSIASVSSEDTSPTGMAFNNDGTKIYMIGSGSDSFHEYNILTSTTLGTISTVQVSKSVLSEDSFPQGMAFNNDGTRIYMIGSGSNSFHEYDLPTPFDIAGISTVQTSASVSSEDTVPTGMAFNNDGTKIYMIGAVSASFHEYNLGTAFDISTISTVQASASVSSEDTTPRGMAFNNDGTKIYMIGDSSDSFHEYNLGTAFDISTISTVQVSVSVFSEDASPQGMAFNNDGSKIFMIGGGSDSFHEYDLLIPFDISTISTVQENASLIGEDSFPTAMAFNNDISKIYMIGNSSNSFHEYNL